MVANSVVCFGNHLHVFCSARADYCQGVIFSWRRERTVLSTQREQTTHRLSSAPWRTMTVSSASGRGLFTSAQQERTTVKVSSAPAETNEPRRLLSRRRSECRRFLVNRVVRFRRPFHAVCFAKNERSCFILLLFFVPTFSSHCRAVSPPPLVSL